MKTSSRARACLAALLLAWLLPLAARGERSLTLTGRVLDGDTKAHLTGASVVVMATDSTILGGGIAETIVKKGGERWSEATFSIVARQPERGDVLVRVSMMGFVPWTRTVPAEMMKKRKAATDLGDILLQPNERTLGTAVVSGTKVKFYHDSDTMVYNADAFDLPQGSALDALLSQLPGVSTDEHGNIFHNGRLVSELLLEGKELLGEDKQRMRELLPAYLLRKVKVYHRQTREARFLGDTHLSGRKYVMDLKLRKESRAAWTGFLEGGTGWGKRGKGDKIPHLVHLFAQRATPQSRLTAYLKDNNVNDDRKPGLYADWTPDRIKEGVQDLHEGGVSYHAQDKDKRWEADGSASFLHDYYRNRSFSTRIHYAGDTDLKEEELVSDHDRRLTFRTSHKWQHTWDRFQLSLAPAAMMQDYELSRSTLMRFTLPEGVNYATTNTLTRGRKYELGLEARGVLKLSNPAHSLLFAAGIKATQDESDKLERDTFIFYFDSQEPFILNNYTRQRPYHALTAQGSAAWAWKPTPTLSTRLTYSVSHTRSTQLVQIFMLDTPEQGPLKMSMIPSEEEYSKGFDQINSSGSEEHTLAQALTPAVSWKKEYACGTWEASLSAPLRLRRERLHYERYLTDTTASRLHPVPDIENTYVTWTSPSHKTTHGLWYSMRGTTPHLVNMVNLYDASDPMHVIVGNSRLRRSTLHTLRYAFASKRAVEVRADWEYRITNNAISKGIEHDPSTGSKVEKAYNIDGNWLTTAHAAVGFGPFRSKRLRITSDTRYSHQESSAISSKIQHITYNHIHTNRILQQLVAQYQYKGQSLALRGDLQWSRTHGWRDAAPFEERGVLDYQYGLAVVVSLPWKMQLATDLTMYSHRGYTDDFRNTDHLMWNARLSQNFLRDRLVVMLDGYDILSRMSAIMYKSDATSRMEVTRDVTPQYILLHAAWKFDITPARKKP